MSKMVEDAFFVGLWLGHRLALELAEAYDQQFRAHPGVEMKKANDAIDEALADFKAEAEEQIQIEYELNRDDVPSLTQQDATDCKECLGKMLDTVVYNYTDEPLLPILLSVLGK